MRRPLVRQARARGLRPCWPPRLRGRRGAPALRGIGGPGRAGGSTPSRRAEAAMLEGGARAASGGPGLQKTMGDRGRLAQDDPGVARTRSASRRPDRRAAPETERFLTELDRFLERTPAGSGAGSAFPPLTVEQTPVTVERRGPRHFLRVHVSPRASLWGIMACAAKLSASGLVMEAHERDSGAASWPRRSPRAPSSWGGKALGCFRGHPARGGHCWLRGRGWRSFTCDPPSPLLLALPLASAAVAFVGIMMLMGRRSGRTEQAASGGRAGRCCW